MDITFKILIFLLKAQILPLATSPVVLCEVTAHNPLAHSQAQQLCSSLNKYLTGAQI